MKPETCAHPTLFSKAIYECCERRKTAAMNGFVDRRYCLSRLLHAEILLGSFCCSSLDRTLESR